MKTMQYWHENRQKQTHSGIQIESLAISSSHICPTVLDKDANAIQGGQEIFKKKRWGGTGYAHTQVDPRTLWLSRCGRLS